MGTMYLMVTKVCQGGYIPFFITERKYSEAALIQVVQEAFPGASWQQRQPDDWFVSPLLSTRIYENAACCPIERRFLQNLFTLV